MELLQLLSKYIISLGESCRVALDGIITSLLPCIEEQNTPLYFNPINGIVSVTINNLNEIASVFGEAANLEWFSFEFKYKFTFQNSMHNDEYYQNNIWMMNPFAYDTIDPQHDAV